MSIGNTREQRPTLRFGLLVGSALLALVSWDTPSFAQDVAAAETLFREGKALMKAGDHTKACAKFAESQRLDPSAGTALNLAACHQKEGRTATAWADYLVAARIAAHQKKPALAEEANARAKELEPALSHILVRPPAGVVGLVISRDGIVMDASSLNTKIPVDPGTHTLQARAPGYRSYEGSILVGGPHDDKVVAIPLLEREASPSPHGAEPIGSTSSGAAPATGAPPSAQAGPMAGQLPPDNARGQVWQESSMTGTGPDGPAATSSARGTAGYVVGGLGLAGVGVGAVLGIAALGKHSRSNELCSSSTCASREGVDAQDSARALGWAADISFAVGALGLGTAAYLLLTSSHSDKRESVVDIVPTALSNGGAVTAMGRW